MFFRHERFWQPLPAKAVRSSIRARQKYRHTTIHSCLRGYKNADCASPPFPLLPQSMSHNPSSHGLYVFWHSIDRQIVKVGSHVEVIAFARIRPVGQIRCGQFTNALSIVSALHVRRCRCKQSASIRCEVTSSIHAPPQKYTHIRERIISLY